MGDWQSIGYSGPGSKTSNSGSQVYASGNFWYAEGAIGSADWSASPRNKLNECAAESSAPSSATTSHSWYLVSKFNKGDGDGEGNITWKADGKAACKGLTPSFTNLIKGRETNEE